MVDHSCRVSWRCHDDRRWATVWYIVTEDLLLSITTDHWSGWSQDYRSLICVLLKHKIVFPKSKRADRRWATAIRFHRCWRSMAFQEFSEDRSLICLLHKREKNFSLIDSLMFCRRWTTGCLYKTGSDTITIIWCKRDFELYFLVLTFGGSLPLYRIQIPYQRLQISSTNQLQISYSNYNLPFNERIFD